MKFTVKIKNITDNEVHYDEYDQDGHFTVSDYWTLERFNQLLLQDRHKSNISRVIDMDIQDFFTLARANNSMTKSYGSYSITASDPTNGFTYSLSFETPQGKKLDRPFFWCSSATQYQLDNQ